MGRWSADPTAMVGGGGGVIHLHTATPNGPEVSGSPRRGLGWRTCGHLQAATPNGPEVSGSQRRELGVAEVWSTYPLQRRTGRWSANPHDQGWGWRSYDPLTFCNAERAGGQRIPTAVVGGGGGVIHLHAATPNGPEVSGEG